MSSDFPTLWLAGRVLRCHVKPVLKNQTIADHSWGVAMILLEVAPAPSVNLLKAAIYHDTAEVITGDLPHHVKREYPALNELIDQIEMEFWVSQGVYPELTQEEIKLLRWADMFEFMLYCAQEIRMGNRTLVPNYKYASAYCDARTPNAAANHLMEKMYEPGI